MQVKRFPLALMAAAAITVLVCGCAVPQHKYNELKEQHDMLMGEHGKLVKDNKDLRTQVDVLTNKLKGEQARIDAMQDLKNTLNEEKAPEAPPEGWATNPKTGGIVLQGDIMFSSGSSTLTAKGKATLKRLAALLKSDKYAEYFVRVDGHTDDVPVKRTIKENKDNWFLSSRRAHSVLTELKALGVGSERLFMVAYGEHHPIAPNKPGRKGTAANRRVEIVLVKEVKTEE